MGKLFGTDGIRGIANRELTPELALRLGRAGAYILAKERKKAPKVLLTKDTRQSGTMLEAALTAGLCSLGAEVYLAGVIPTPAVAFLVRKYELDAGVMISASHNKMEDNGIKFFNRIGQKLSDTLEEEIEKLVAQIETNDTLPRPDGMGVGKTVACPNADTDYMGFLLSTVDGLRLDKDFAIALDCANGATSFIASQVFTNLGAKVYTLHDNPNGANINDNCGSTHLDSLQKFVLETKARIGLAFDGDGDRMLAVDDLGCVLDGDGILAICGDDLHSRGLLKNNTLVGTVMTNIGFKTFCGERGIHFHPTSVGDRYVLEKMLADDLTLGGEQSGHVIFRRFADTGDGILTGLQLIQALVKSNKPLSELRKMLTVFPQILVNIKISNERKYEHETNPLIKSAKEEIETKLADQGRLLIRPSGTEPLVRVMIEGKNQEQITRWAHYLASVIKETLG
jgi:phosphoglucosamine mutase